MLSISLMIALNLRYEICERAHKFDKLDKIEFECIQANKFLNRPSRLQQLCSAFVLNIQNYASSSLWKLHAHYQKFSQSFNQIQFRQAVKFASSFTVLRLVINGCVSMNQCSKFRRFQYAKSCRCKSWWRLQYSHVSMLQQSWIATFLQFTFCILPFEWIVCIPQEFRVY